MFRYLLFFILLHITGLACSQVNVRLFYGEQSDALVIRIIRGEYQIMADGLKVGSVGIDDMLFVSRGEGTVIVSFSDRPGFVADSIWLQSSGIDDIFSLKRVGVDDRFTEFDGNMAIENDLGTLLVINNTDIEKYIAAVVQAEGGHRAHPEYFKTQAVIVRTYYFKHNGKHGDEGYDLCDDVHCQAYLGRCIEQAIFDAVLSTAGLVIADADTNLIIAPFHSNCGGETVAAEEVWLTGKPYLVPVIDPYCLFSRNASWEKRIGRQEWVGYLRDSGYSGDEGAITTSFSQVARTRYYIAGDFRIPFTGIRNDLRLRSSFFSLEPDGETMLLTGKGYGHGVGLCQEGAMVMASRGFGFDSIIRFYYNNVTVMDVSNVKITGQEVETF